MPVEVRPPSVIDRGRPWVLVTGGKLHVPERDTGIECCHDEGTPKHVRVDDSETGSRSDGAHPAMGGSAIEAFAVHSAQDRTIAAFADGEIDRPSSTGDEWDHCWLVALAENPQRPMTPLYPQVLDVAGTGFADP